MSLVKESFWNAGHFKARLFILLYINGEKPGGLCIKKSSNIGLENFVGIGDVIYQI